MKGFNIGSQKAGRDIINISGDFHGIITIEFQDHGQDFLEWDVCLETGKVLDCRPFKGHLWIGNYVQEPKGLKTGDRVYFSYNPIDPSNKAQLFNAINYPIEKITYK